MKTKAIFVSVLMLFVALLACASYKPTPAPVPMKTFEAYTGEVIHGFFNIEDGSGPEGMTIIVEPNVLKITSRVMTPIAGFPNARRYTFYFDYTFGDTSQIVTIKSYDKRKHEVINSIVFNLLEDEPQVFTECGEITTEPNEPVSYLPITTREFLRRAEAKMRYRTRSNMVWEYNRVVTGKANLSRQYKSLDELKDLITKIDDPHTVVSYGRIIE